MALKHWGGTVPEKLTEWTCPSCGHVQTTPLKAGCQACGAGADARKVGGEAPQPLAERADALREAEVPGIHTGFDDWYQGPEADRDLAWRAFVAGVGWAHQQLPSTRAAVAAVAALASPPPEVSGGAPVTSPVTLWLDDGKHQDPLEAPTLQTILAALAFYRDHHLGYGAVPGQLSAEAVTALIARLTPQEAA